MPDLTPERLAEFERLRAEINEWQLRHQETFAFYEDQVRQTDQLRAELERTRAELAEAVDALKPFTATEAGGFTTRYEDCEKAASVIVKHRKVK